MEAAVLLEKIDEQQNIYQLTFNRPHQLHAIDSEILKELQNHLQTLAEKEVQALIISSNTEKAFCAGINVKHIQAFSNESAADFFSELATTLEILAETHFPTIACISGYAFGAGADIALACDLRIAAPSASFRFPGPQFGLVLGTERLVNEIGAAKARELVLTNKRIFVEEAKEIGLVHDILSEELLASGLKIARDLNNVPKHTYQMLKEVCSQQSGEKSAASLARDSVLIGDFQQRFTKYLDQMKQKK